MNVKPVVQFSLAALAAGILGTSLMSQERASGVPSSGGLVQQMAELYQPGMIIAYAGNMAPPGWEMCDGREINPDVEGHKYAKVHAIIGTKYDPQGQKRLLPNLIGRVVVGAGNGELALLDNYKRRKLTSRTLGEYFGEEVHQLSISEMPAHNHEITDPGHSHGYFRGQTSGGDGAVASSQPYPTSQTTVEKTNIIIQNSGNGVSHNNMQPGLAINYIIKL